MRGLGWELIHRDDMTRKSFALLSLVLFFCLAPATLSGQEAGLKQPSFDSDGVAIHYIVTGPDDGEPVVLIHGFAGTIEMQWGQIIPDLKKDFKVIALDCRGHGGSGKPHDPAKYGVEMGNDVARLLDHLKIDKAHVVGYSMGAGIALSFAVHHPQRVRSVTLGGSSGMNGREHALVLAVADSLEKGNGFGPLLIALTPKNQPKPTTQAIKLIDNAILSFNDPKALAAAARGAVGDEISDTQVEAIKAPVLSIIGADDPLHEDVERLKTLLPTARIVVIDKANHMTAYSRPEFIAELRKFLNENRQPPVK
jgi:pimeloyl-ACP methyl ester carboxylesterase